MTESDRARRLVAGAAGVSALREVEDRGSNLIAEALRGQNFVALRHYPENDAFDPATGAQYYFHAHEPGEHRQHSATWDEIGHIHTFFRPEGQGDHKPIHHLVAIALNRFGRPAGLFTTNRWVTGEDFCSARRSRAFVRRYKLSDPSPLSRFVTAIVALFRADIVRLLTARDAAIAVWQRRHSGTDAFEDRALEITSSLPIDLPEVLAQLQDQLDSPSASGSGCI